MKPTQFSGTRIILVRHGETEWNRLHRFQGISDIPLNQKGNEQARALALALQKENFAAIYASPLDRAAQTARHIAKFHQSTPLREEAGFREMDLGDFEGMQAGSWATKYQEFRQAWETSPATLAMPGGESLEDVQQRAVAALERVCEPHAPDSTLLICSHNFVIGCLLCFAANIPLDDFRQVKQETAALSVIYKNGVDFEVETVNDCRHLDKYSQPTSEI